MIHNAITITTPTQWNNYQLIDTGNFEKLERFGQWIVARPEPQAVWDKSLSDKEWQAQAHAIFKKDKNNPEKGQWHQNHPIQADKWILEYKTSNLHLKFKLSLSAFKHVGVFPEQADNWDFIAHTIETWNVASDLKFLNLFAYTGGASLAARQKGAFVTHVDSIKQVISWARENMELNHLTDIRWMVEDAAKFVQREVKRGNQYQGIILDPPAYGRGPDGEKWILEEKINTLLKDCNSLLHPAKHFLIINLYSLGFSALVLDNLLQNCFPDRTIEVGELYLEDSFHKKLPLGIYGRFIQGEV